MFKRNYKQYREKSDKALIYATALTFKWEIVQLMLLASATSILGFAQPYATKLTIDYIKAEDAEPGLSTLAYIILAYNCSQTILRRLVSMHD